MDKGIRPEARKKFLELLPTRENSRLGNRNFRAAVITHIMESFDATLASAATHYNEAFIHTKKLSETQPELVKLLEGLGRPEDKKGGRKKKVVEAAPASGNTDLGPMPDAPTKFLVKKAKDGAVVGEFDTEEEAKARVAENEGKKFVPKLFWIPA